MSLFVCFGSAQIRQSGVQCSAESSFLLCSVSLSVFLVIRRTALQFMHAGNRQTAKALSFRRFFRSLLLMPSNEKGWCLSCCISTRKLPAAPLICLWVLCLSFNVFLSICQLSAVFKLIHFSSISIVWQHLSNTQTHCLFLPFHCKFLPCWAVKH